MFAIDKEQLSNQILNLIQPVLNSMGEMQNIWLKFVDTSGKYILTSQTSSPCNFCQLIRSTPTGLGRCHNTARLAVKQSEMQRGPVKSRCHAGLTTITVPVMIEGKCLGALVAGEIIEQSLYEEIKQAVLQNTSDLNIDRNRLVQYFNEIPIWPEKSIDIITRCLDAFSNCFIEVGALTTKKEKTELEKHLREMELKALQSQINPHFLFNTLNTIEMLAVMEGANQTSQIVHALAQLFRRNLYANSNMVTIYQELDSVNNYLTIQKCRFGNKLEIINNIPDYLLNMAIPALTLQPLVENAITHGLEPVEEKGVLKLEGYLEHEDIVLQVIDNGIGISRVELFKIQQSLDKPDGEISKLGLINVQKRCRLHFKAPYGISITSAPGKGTTVSLRLPAQISRVGVGDEAVNS